MSTPDLNTKAFDRVIVIMFENMYRSYVMKNKFMRGLANQGIDMVNYFGVMHPSQTNYIASIAGELCNVTEDDRPVPQLTQNTIVDLFESAQPPVSWKAYMDSYQPLQNPWTPDFQAEDQFPYLIKHNPFSSFQNITSNQARWEKVTNEIAFFEDAASGNLPQFSWFTPNMWNDGHYIVGTQKTPPERAPLLVDQLAHWLEYFFGVLQFPGPDSLIPKGTLVVVTFDEADYEADWDKGKKYTYDGPNQVYTVLLGDMIQPGRQEQGYNHYSLIKTIEKNFGLGSLQKNDQHCNSFEFLWGKQFAWGESVSTPIQTSGCIASAELGGKLVVLYESIGKNLVLRSFDGSAWSAEQTIGQGPVNYVALCALNDTLHFAIQSNGELMVLACKQDPNQANAWLLSPETRTFAGVKNISLCAFNETRLMLAWQDDCNQLQSLSYQDGAWADAVVAVGHQTDGHLCLGSIGPSLYLIHKEVGSDGMMVISYNAAQFNVVNCPVSTYSGPFNDTTINQWSPSAVPVCHFSHMASPVTPEEQEPATRAYSGKGPLVVATLYGVMYLVHQSATSDALEASTALESETFSISGIMTPKLPISYNASDATTTSDGYGTLAEAGWSTQRSIGVQSKGRIALAKMGERLVLLSDGDEGVVMTIGGLD